MPHSTARGPKFGIRQPSLSSGCVRREAGLCVATPLAGRAAWPRPQKLEMGSSSAHSLRLRPKARGKLGSGAAVLLAVSAVICPAASTFAAAPGCRFCTLVCSGPLSPLVSPAGLSCALSDPSNQPRIVPSSPLVSPPPPTPPLYGVPDTTLITCIVSLNPSAVEALKQRSQGTCLRSQIQNTLDVEVD